MQENEMNLVAV